MSFPVTTAAPFAAQRGDSISGARNTAFDARLYLSRCSCVPGKMCAIPIASMPGVAQQSVDMFLEECREVEQLGIPGIILFGIPEKKDALGTEAYAADGVVQRAIEAVRKAKLNLLVMTDVCLCEYTDHGHCGIVENGEVKNDPTLELLAEESLSHARAGADIIAPSDMMDGRVGAIRKALDGGGFQDVAIMSYAAKYCSGFYGPFREAAESAPQFGDRRGYQMDPANAREALREVELDLAEGADMVMVKPALAYLDIIQQRARHIQRSGRRVQRQRRICHGQGRRGQWLDRGKAHRHGNSDRAFIAPARALS